LRGEPRDSKTMVPAGGKGAEATLTANTGADKGKLMPTDIGVVVNEFLTEHFPKVLDYNFTADLEERFDLVAEGQAKWKKEIGDFYEVFHPEVERANEMRLEHKVGERVLGTDPASGKPVSVKIGRFGPVVQIGESTDEEKPRFASLRKEQSVFDITLEDALKLFELPRVLGDYEDAEVSVAVGRFGPYVRHAGKFVSLPKDLSPMEVTLEEAIALINAKREADSKKVVKEFSEDEDLQILNGRYGVYICYKKGNYKIPKTVADPSALTHEECMKIVEEQDSKPRRTTTRRAAASRRTKK
ncbi:MAG: DNA topoisomerase I, partial [Paramuribaculum sp.]|nr:DNA topoisomerase I [Paramuribaculum sp.]